MKNKDVKRKTLFIVTNEQEIYLPRPSSWTSGWARHLWFTHVMDKSPKIASPDYWKMLSDKYDTQILLEHHDGQTTILSSISESHRRPHNE